MSATDMQALVRSVIIIFGLPYAVVSVIEAPAAWNVIVRAGTGEIVRFTVEDGARDDMRMTIQRVLQAER